MPTGFAGRYRTEGAYARVTHGDGAQLAWKFGIRRSRTEVDLGEDGRLGRFDGDHFGSSHGLVFHLQGLSGDEFYARNPTFDD